jgi:hypothetical protein
MQKNKIDRDHDSHFCDLHVCYGDKEILHGINLMSNPRDAGHLAFLVRKSTFCARWWGWKN